MSLVTFQVLNSHVRLVTAILVLHNIFITRESSVGLQNFRKLMVIGAGAGSTLEGPRAEVMVTGCAVELERSGQIRDVESTRLANRLDMGSEGKSGIKETS